MMLIGMNVVLVSELSVKCFVKCSWLVMFSGVERFLCLGLSLRMMLIGMCLLEMSFVNGLLVLIGVSWFVFLIRIMCMFGLIVCISVISSLRFVIEVLLIISRLVCSGEFLFCVGFLLGI